MKNTQARNAPRLPLALALLCAASLLNVNTPTTRRATKPRGP